MTEWPKFRMARDLAGPVFPVSEDVILQTARKYGIGRKMGRAIIFSPNDCHRLYEVLPCPSGSFAALNRPIGSSAVQSGACALRKALELTTSASLERSERSAKPKSSNNRSTVVALPAPSRKPR